MSDLSDFKRLVYEPETKALRERVAELERERDELEERWLGMRDCYDREVLRVGRAERRVAKLEAALRPFAEDAEAFDSHHPYGDGPVFERLSVDYHWKFTVADVMRARAALAGHGGGSEDIGISGDLDADLDALGFDPFGDGGGA